MFALPARTPQASCISVSRFASCSAFGAVCAHTADTTSDARKNRRDTVDNIINGYDSDNAGRGEGGWGDPAETRLVLSSSPPEAVVRGSRSDATMGISESFWGTERGSCSRMKVSPATASTITSVVALKAWQRSSPNAPTRPLGL